MYNFLWIKPRKIGWYGNIRWGIEKRILDWSQFYPEYLAKIGPADFDIIDQTEIVKRQNSSTTCSPLGLPAADGWDKTGAISVAHEVWQEGHLSWIAVQPSTIISFAGLNRNSQICWFAYQQQFFLPCENCVLGRIRIEDNFRCCKEDSSWYCVSRAFNTWDARFRNSCAQIHNNKHTHTPI